MAAQLTSGVIERLLTEEVVKGPVVQVLGLKKIQQQGPNDRYRVMISDGVHQYSSTMLASQLNSLVESGALEAKTVIRLNKYVCNIVGSKENARKVLIILECEVLTAARDTEKIGNPVMLQNNTVLSNNQPNQQQQQPPAKSSSFYGNTPARTQGTYNKMNQAPASYNSSSSVSRTNDSSGSSSHGGANHVPIAAINPYQNRYMFTARVESKGAMRTWSNSRGEGKLFNCTLIDKSSAIRATGFNEEAAKYYDLLEVNKVYNFSGLQVKAADKRYSNLPNDYELTFTRLSVVTIADEDKSIPKLQANFVTIEHLANTNVNSYVDIIGILESFGDLVKIVVKASQKEVSKRDIHLVDDSRKVVQATIWGQEAEEFNPQGNPVVVLRSAKVSDWNGRSLSTMGSSSIMINPDIPECFALRGWWDSVGCREQFTSLSTGSGGEGSRTTNWKHICQIKDESLGNGVKADWFTVKGTVVYFRKENCLYQACPQEGCNKKVLPSGNGLFTCERCKQDFEDFKWRMILSCNVADFSGNQWITCFQESGQAILGVSAVELGRLKDENAEEFDNVFTQATFKSFVFTVKAHVESYNDEHRLKCIAASVKALDAQEYSRRLLEEINEMHL